ncbi:DNA mismatch repair endonuclease MutL [Porphyromonas sp.]|uniref:DNA mismatch repair endonuclease MutL n=1 Tax=Porphyromonas sp. TaxID=1924944 RepID=UPI0026DC41EF|nr:DNA mismatch repair endonuclease MutL [Porphyromonas sp.]MDO4695728.1 DNA mismatch repair endonuclease MutL [Porphyromonas sp.]MDO4771746.1 DNA mismatch repair endonuclease MutL [Porphyromonas sp.]
MDNIINLLPDNIANQIAAGEVIQRPASVIKELVENSIDAGATEIVIEIKQAGKTLIQVIDNGKGMAPMDARMAFERHATSKIKTADDLFSLTTMGFRGEALASIAAVAQIVLQTKPHDADMGTRVEIEASKVINSSPVVCSPGANFSIKNLFFNIPARRKFLKADDTEFKHIVTEVQRVAVVHPSTCFTLTHNDQLVLKLESTSLKQRVIDIFGKRFIDILLSLETNTPLVNITGFIGRASSSRKRGAQQHFFVNGRFMRHPYFHRSVMNAYEGMIPAGDQPEYFIFFDVEPSSIDVNIHPTKTEIKFEAESDIGKILYSAVREVLMKGAAVPSINFDEDNPVDIPTFVPMDISDMNEPPIVSSRINGGGRSGAYLTSSSSESEQDENYSLPVFSDLPKEFQLPEISDWDEFYRSFEANRILIDRPSSATVPKSVTVGSSMLIPSSMIGKPEPQEILLPGDKVIVFGEYGIISRDKELLIVHLYRARTKIIYQEYMDAIGRENIISSPLLFPELIDLGIKEARILDSYRDSLQLLGFDISEMGKSSYAINAIPYGMPAGNEGELLLEILDECSSVDKSSEEVIHHRLVTALTEFRLKHESPMFTAEDASQVISKLMKIPNYLTSPSGKTIVSVITTKELIKRFGD